MGDRFAYAKTRRCTHAKPWSRSGLFPNACVELKLCTQQATTLVASGKIFPSNKKYWIHLKSQFSRPKNIHSLRFTCHATCPLAQEYYSPRRRAASRRHMRKPVWTPALRKQTILYCWVPQGFGNRTFSWQIAIWHVHWCTHARPWPRLGFSLLHVWSWHVAYSKLQPLWQAEK